MIFTHCDLSLTWRINIWWSSLRNCSNSYEQKGEKEHHSDYVNPTFSRLQIKCHCFLWWKCFTLYPPWNENYLRLSDTTSELPPWYAGVSYHNTDNLQRAFKITDVWHSLHVCSYHQFHQIRVQWVGHNKISTMQFWTEFLKLLKSSALCFYWWCLSVPSDGGITFYMLFMSEKVWEK